MRNRWVDALVARRVFGLQVVSLCWPCTFDHETGEWEPMELRRNDAGEIESMYTLDEYASGQPVYEGHLLWSFPLLVPHYTTAAAADLSVHQHVCTEPRWRHWDEYYFDALETRLYARVPFVHSVRRSLRHGYLPLMAYYQIGDYSHAALRVARIMRRQEAALRAKRRQEVAQ